jgi:hypothetical protein
MDGDEVMEVVRARHEAPGGWRRALAGVLLGAAFGTILARLFPSSPGR